MVVVVLCKVLLLKTIECVITKYGAANQIYTLPLFQHWCVCGGGGGGGGGATGTSATELKLNWKNSIFLT